MPYMLLVLLSLGHLFADLCGGVLPMLLPVLKDQFQLSYTALGMLVLVFNISGSVLQPVFGVWSDRCSARWMLPMGCLLSAAGLVIVGFAPSYLLVLVGILIAGAGTGAYHPEGSRQTFLISGNRQATAQSIYSVGGNIGFGLGPVAASLMLALGGSKGLVWLLLPAGVMAMMLWRNLSDLYIQGDTTKKIVAFTDSDPVTRQAWGALTLLVGIVIIRSLVYIGLTTFIPLYFVNYLHGSHAFAGMMLTAFLMAGALGTCFGGPLADRWGRKKILFISFLLVITPVWLLSCTSGNWSLVMAIWSGFALISTFAITTVIGQELLPGHEGLVSGLLLGLSVGIAAFGALGFGAIADAWGVPVVLKLVSLLPIPALLLCLALPEEKREAIEKNIAS